MMEDINLFYQDYMSIFPLRGEASYEVRCAQAINNTIDLLRRHSGNSHWCTMESFYQIKENNKNHTGINQQH